MAVNDDNERQCITEQNCVDSFQLTCLLTDIVGISLTQFHKQLKPKPLTMILASMLILYWCEMETNDAYGKRKQITIDFEQSFCEIKEKIYQCDGKFYVKALSKALGNMDCADNGNNNNRIGFIISNGDGFLYVVLIGNNYKRLCTMTNNNDHNRNNYNDYSSSNNGYHGRRKTLNQYGESNNGNNNFGNCSYLSKRTVGDMHGSHSGNHGDDMERDYFTQYSNSDAVSPSKRGQRSVYSSQGTEYGDIPHGSKNNNNNSSHMSSTMHNSGGNGGIHDSNNGNNNNNNHSGVWR